MEDEATIVVPSKATGINASDVEHIGALLSGTLLLLTGLKKGGGAGLLFKTVGIALIYRGQHGYRRLYDALGLELPAEATGVGRLNERAEASIEIDRPAAELYGIWRKLENLPIFMNHLVSVHELDEKRSLWTARAAAGMVVKWEAEIINDVKDELIAWRTLEGSGVDSAGSVRFEKLGEDRTRVHVVMSYDPPADLAGVWIAKMLGSDAQTQIEQDLRHFKEILEIGGRQYEERRRQEEGRPQADVL
jgi:uncharacterized membrane protein